MALTRALVFCQLVLLISSANCDAQERQPVTWSLLVGVCEYPQTRRTLQGPDHDVELMSSLLKERFQVTEERLIILTEGSDVQRLPTRSNLEAAFRSLAAQVAPGDQVLIMLAGHGTQQPDFSADHEEPDGLDEVFLPRDAGRWGDQQKAVINGITDDELREWLAAITQKGADVLFVADCCHSGTLTRGETAISRNVKPEDLGVPANLLSVARNRQRRLDEQANSRRGESRGSGKSDAVPAASNLGRLVSIAASQPNQRTWSERIPRYGKYYGRLTWAISSILRDAGDSGLTYGELEQRILSIYQQNGWTTGIRVSKPLLEMADDERHRPVLSLQKWSPRSKIVLQQATEGGGYQISAGELDGITKDTVLAVFPNGLSELAGFVRVTEAGLLRSLVAATDFDGYQSPVSLPLPATCEIRWRSQEEYQLWVSLDLTQVADMQQRADARLRLEKVLQDLCAAPESLVAQTPADLDPDLYVTAAADLKTLVIDRASAVSRDENGRALLTDSMIDRISIDSELQANLGKRLNQRAKAANLRRLSEFQSRETAVRLEVRLQRMQAGEWQTIDELEPQLFNRDKVRLEIENKSAVAVDLTILFIFSNEDIYPVFPWNQPPGNRVGPGQKLTGPELDVSVETQGSEDFIVLGEVAKLDTYPSSFIHLANIWDGPRPATTRRGSETPLDALTRSLGSGASRNRSVPATPSSGFAIVRLPCRVSEKSP